MILFKPGNRKSAELISNTGVIVGNADVNGETTGPTTATGLGGYSIAAADAVLL